MSGTEPLTSAQGALRRRLLAWSKWVWIALVLFFAARYAWRQGGQIVEVLDRLPWTAAGLSLAGLIAAKLLLPAALRISVRQVGFRLTWPKSFSVYQITQLAKYTPGGIWQFVGKAALYARQSMSGAQIRDAILLEAVSEPAGALLIALLFWGRWPTAVWARWQELAGGILIVLAAGALVLLGWWRLSARERRAGHWQGGLARFSLRMLPVQLGIWLALGFSFHALRMVLAPGSLGSSLGLYGLAYVIGFLVPVAPAGLGVRESILVLGLGGDADTAWVIAGLHRLLFIAVEIVAAGAAVVWDQAGGRAAARSHAGVAEREQGA